MLAGDGTISTVGSSDIVKMTRGERAICVYVRNSVLVTIKSRILCLSEGRVYSNRSVLWNRSSRDSYQSFRFRYEDTHVIGERRTANAIIHNARSVKVSYIERSDWKLRRNPP
eukprot:scaffold4445_cov132-Cylindrotheca_fusiformis.AAC.8